MLPGQPNPEQNKSHKGQGPGGRKPHICCSPLAQGPLACVASDTWDQWHSSPHSEPPATKSWAGRGVAGLPPGAEKISMDDFHLPPMVPQPRAQAPQAFFSSTDSGNKLTPLNCGKWELSEKLIDGGGEGGEGEDGQ